MDITFSVKLKSDSADAPSNQFECSFSSSVFEEEKILLTLDPFG